MHSDTTGDFMWFLRLTWDHCVSHVAIPFSTTIEIEKSMDHDNITSCRISLGLCTNHQGRWSARREPAPEVSSECCRFFLDTEWHGLGMMCVSSYTHACHKQVRPYMYSTMMRIILSNQRYFNTLGEKSHGTWRSWLTTLGSRLWIGSIYYVDRHGPGPHFPISNHCQCPPEKNPPCSLAFWKLGFHLKMQGMRLVEFGNSNPIPGWLSPWTSIHECWWIRLHLSLASLNHWITKN